MSIYFAKNFKYIEIACPHCGKNRPLDPRLIFLLQALRDKINLPIIISSGGGLRCPVYNKQIGGYADSPHLYGKAVDISVKGMDIFTLARIAKEVGFNRIGIYPYNYFIHVDVVEPYPSASWVRQKDGRYKYFLTLEKALLWLKKISLTFR